ncbi:YaaC family protein [Paenibacillus durus]|uniref:YaaC family protein n=1 Tax=Paenibacillus durus TaxID=44251 RepID=UPI00069391C8|nr:YaaC family protein [Paenibacillus durus]
MAGPIYYKRRLLTVKSATVTPNLGGKTVLASEPWTFVESWLRNKSTAEAAFYWEQARNFYLSSKSLPPTAAPLPLYYCFLNAAKTLLIVKKQAFSNSHGVAGNFSGTRLTRPSTEDEKIRFKTRGILAALSRLLDDHIVPGEYEYNLDQVFYNIPYIHRAYSLSYDTETRAVPELFIPLRNPHFVSKLGSSQSWFVAEIEPDPRYANGHTINKLPSGFERVNNINDRFVIRLKRRFNWSKEKMETFEAYHRKLRKYVMPIVGKGDKRWYMRRGSNGDKWIDRSPVTLAYAAMHRLSELSRYNPMILRGYLSGKHNWIITEFIQKSPYQFINEISSEITGFEFLDTGVI